MAILVSPTKTILVVASILCISLWLSTFFGGKSVDLPARWHPPGNTTAARLGVVIPTIKVEEVWWIDKEHLSSFKFFIYCMSGRPSPLCHTPHTPQGREAAAYLSFVLDYYDDLPDYTFFLHSDHLQRHNDVSSMQDRLLPAVRLSAIDHLQYANLRCEQAPGCPLEITLPDGPVSKDIRYRFPELYKTIMGQEMPPRIGSTCCAQFVVTRERIRARSRQEYERMMSWLHSKETSFDKGWVFEKIWHIIFGKPAIDCPTMDQCRCDLYGWCGPLATGGTLIPAG